jgi:hypothetical protein
METTSKRVYWVAGSLLLATLLFLGACRALVLGGATPTEDPLVPSETCPEATPEYFQVQPVTSPTSDLTQTIVAELGNAEVITVTTESGTFTAAGAYPTEIEITLLPGTTHNLTVSGRVKEVQQGDCTYGGYELSTTRDVNGGELVIVQQP